MTAEGGSGLVKRVIGAINAGDPERFTGLVDPEVEIVTGRKVHSGLEAARVWIEGGYDHLDRRYEIEIIEGDAGRFVALGRVQYVWRESGEVGDEQPAGLGMRFNGEALTELVMFDDHASARAGLRR